MVQFEFQILFFNCAGAEISDSRKGSAVSPQIQLGDSVFPGAYIHAVQGQTEIPSDSKELQCLFVFSTVLMGQPGIL